MRKKLFAAVLVLLVGCQQQMARQPSYRPLQASPLFPDGTSARPLVQGTIHRDFMPASGKKPGNILGWQRAAALVGQAPGNPLEAAITAADWPIYVETFPFPVTEKVLARGQERFNIYCAVCHDRLGNGKGMIVQRGFTEPPNFHTDLSRGYKLRGVEMPLTTAPVGYFFEVITHGFGAMPDYAGQVPPDDRWAIVAYMRALQFSQAAALNDVASAAEKKKLEDTRGKQR